MHIAAQLSEIGVMLLMFGVGLHFSITDLLRVKKIAIPGAIVQMSIATLMGMAVATAWGWALPAAIVFGVSLSCASTVVLIKALERQGVLESMNGRIAVGWLVVEDLVTVVALVLLPALATMLDPSRPETTGSDLLIDIGKTILQVAAFIAVMLLVGKRLIPKMLWVYCPHGIPRVVYFSYHHCRHRYSLRRCRLIQCLLRVGGLFCGSRIARIGIK